MGTYEHRQTEEAAPGYTELCIDLNCDVGESFGAYTIGDDAGLLRYATSANIACGYHAGDPGTMRRTVKLCLERGVAIGAHPGLPDLSGFGRRKLDISPQEAYDMIVYQVAALEGFARAQGGKLHHVKPHGALYNMAAADATIARAIAEAVYDIDPELILYGLAGSESMRLASIVGLRAAGEAFADRAYGSDGTLASRRLSGAVHKDPEQIARQACGIVREGKISTLDGGIVEIRAETICLHGDGQDAVLVAGMLKERLEREGVRLKPV